MVATDAGVDSALFGKLVEDSSLVLANVCDAPPAAACSVLINASSANSLSGTLWEELLSAETEVFVIVSVLAD